MRVGAKSTKSCINVVHVCSPGFPHTCLRSGSRTFCMPSYICTPALFPQSFATPYTTYSLPPQVAGARAERDTLADQNAALARTTHQLMTGSPADLDVSFSSGGVGSLSTAVSLSAEPLSTPASYGGGGVGSIGVGAAGVAVRQRAASDPVSTGAQEVHGGGAQTASAPGGSCAWQCLNSSVLHRSFASWYC